MENKPTYINAKIQNAERVDIYTQPNTESKIVETISRDTIYQVDVSRVYWSYKSTQFYKTISSLGEGYIETFYVKII